MATSRPNTLIHMKETVAYNNLQNDPQMSLLRTAITTTFLATARARVEAQRPFCWRVGWVGRVVGLLCAYLMSTLANVSATSGKLTSLVSHRHRCYSHTLGL